MDPEPWSDGGLGRRTLSAIDARIGNANMAMMSVLFNDGIVDWTNQSAIYL